MEVLKRPCAVSRMTPRYPLGRGAAFKVKGPVDNSPTGLDFVTIIAEENRFSKARALWAGALKKDKAETPNASEDILTWGAAYGLAIIIQGLTSSDKFYREKAKKEVRELVKLGKEEGK